MSPREPEQPEVRLPRVAGRRWTQQRRLILQTLRQAGGRHMTADEVWRAVSQQHATLNRSTVYRSLEALAGLGLVRQTRLGGAVSQFELAGDAHHHLVCVRCQQSFVLPAADVVTLDRRLVEEHGFHLLPGALSVEGVCGACEQGSAGHHALVAHAQRRGGRSGASRSEP